MRLTTSVELNLTTADTLAVGLRHVGFGWAHAPWLSDRPSPDHLYAWCTACAGSDLSVLYIGIDESTKGTRLAREEGMSGVEYVHGHARAVQRTGAFAVAAPLIEYPATLDWAFKLRSDATRDEMLSNWNALRAERDRPLPIAEHFGVRLTQHVGDTGAPVNSQYKGAWAPSGAHAKLISRMAELVAEHLVSEEGHCELCDSDARTMG